MQGKVNPGQGAAGLLFYAQEYIEYWNPRGGIRVGSKSFSHT